MEFKRDIGTAGILFASVGAMVGSGWLFGSLYAAQLAGPAALLSWIIAGFFIIIIALTFAELGTLFPIAGGIANYPFFTHGKFLGFLLGWIGWLSFVVIPPIEVQAALQYGSHFFPFLVKKTGTAHEITAYGYVVAAVLMWFLVYINNKGIKFLSETNKWLSVWKLSIPFMAIAIFFSFSNGFDSLTTGSPGGFAPNGWHGILSALALAGVVFSFNGFQAGILMAAETKDPQRSIPRGVIGAVLLGTVLYGLLQLSFLLAVPRELLSGGWSGLAFTGDAGPLAALALMLGVGWLAVLLFVDAIVAPLGTGLVYVTATARIMYGMGANGFLPPFVTKMNKNGIPEMSIWINFFVGMFMFLPFPGWQSMVAFLSSIMIASFAIVPVCLVALRKNLPDRERPFRLPFYKITCLVAFYICNLLLFWSGWEILFKLILCVVIGTSIYIGYLLYKKEFVKNISDILGATWLFVFLGGFAVISKLGTYGGGTGQLGEGWDFLVIFVFSLITFKLSQMNVLKPEQSKANVDKIVGVSTL